MPPEAAASPMASPLFPAFIIFLIFYFLVIKPQKDKQKQHKESINKLKKNDRIVTAGGIHGTVVMIKDKTVVVRVDDNTKIEFDKDSISAVTKSKEN